LERSSDGISYRIIELVKAAGSSFETKNYGTTDTRPLAGTSYYRLKMRDLDGMETYSQIRYVQRDASQAVRFFSNLIAAGEPIRLTLDAPVLQGEASVFTLDGRLVLHRPLPATDAGAQLEFPSLSLPGTYVLKLIVDGDSFSIKLTVR
jgi:hypothetical protein